jgi:hypothetical protein
MPSLILINNEENEGMSMKFKNLIINNLEGKRKVVKGN